MLNKISSKLTEALNKLNNKDQKIAHKALDELEIALIDCDVSQSAAESFIENVKKNKESHDSWLECLHISLVELLTNSEHGSEINLKAKRPAVILMAGIQGAGKTTTAAKIAIKYSKKLKVMACSTDTYRPAAMEQLKILLEPHSITTIAQEGNEDPIAIARNALAKAKNSNYDLLIIDTAGRQHDNELMMQEIKTIQSDCSPIETLMVVDGMAGNFAVESAREFLKHINLTGFILTKMDGNQKGGAAISLTHETKLPVKFLGTGEKTDKLDIFDADRFAKIILDLGDQTGFLEKLENIDIKKQRQAEKSLRTGNFDFNQFLSQIEQIDNLGGASEILGKLPGTKNLINNSQAISKGEQNIKATKAMILSMTYKERANPSLLENKSRRKRIVQGSASDVRSFNMMMKQFKQMQKMMQKFKGKNFAKIMQQMQDRLN